MSGGDGKESRLGSAPLVTLAVGWRSVAPQRGERAPPTDGPPPFHRHSFPLAPRRHVSTLGPGRNGTPSANAVPLVRVKVSAGCHGRCSLVVPISGVATDLNAFEWRSSPPHERRLSLFSLSQQLSTH